MSDVNVCEMKWTKAVVHQGAALAHLSYFIHMFEAFRLSS